MIRAFLLDSRAAAAVEMALIVPLLIMLMLGVAEGSFLLWNEHVIVKSVREGARYAARQPYSKLCPTLDSTTSSSINLLTRTGQTYDSSATARIRNWTSSGVTITTTCSGTGVAGGIYTILPNGAATVTVVASTPYPSLFKRFGLTKAAINATLNAQDSAPVTGI